MRIRNIYILALLFFTFSCKQQNKVEGTVIKNEVVEKKGTVLGFEGVTVDSTHLKLELQLDTINVSVSTEDCSYGDWLKSDSTNINRGVVYVSNKQGTKYYKLADSTSENLGSFEFGEKLIVIDTNHNWFRIVSNRAKGKPFWYYACCYSGFVQKKDAIDSLDADFSIIPTISEETYSYDDSHLSFRDSLRIKFVKINSNQYGHYKSNYENEIVFDSSKVSKRDTFFTLKTENILVKCPCEISGEKCHSYKGYLPSINSYIIDYFGTESLVSTYAIDKETAKEIVFEGFNYGAGLPIVSKEGNKILVFSPNYFEGTSCATLFIKNKNDNEFKLKKYDFLDFMVGYVEEFVWIDSDNIALLMSDEQPHVEDREIYYLQGTILNKY